MSGNPAQKKKILYIMKILNERSDEDHVLSSADIIRELGRYGIDAERKSIYRDIETLAEAGVDIQYAPAPQRGYFVGNRDFELPELILLVDAIQSSRFVTVKKSEKLIKKIEKLTSKSNAAELHKQVFIYNRVKTFNERVLTNINTINDAILKNKKITFKYLTFNLDKEQVEKYSGKKYNVSPYAMTWRDDNYYLICNQEETGLKVFRVDRMSAVDIDSTDRKSLYETTGKDDFDIAKYCEERFLMYSGEKMDVKIKFDNSLIDVVIDRFGKEIFLSKNNDGTFNVSTTINFSPTFISWLFMFGDKAELLSPKEAVDDVKIKLNEIMKKYNDK